MHVCMCVCVLVCMCVCMLGVYVCLCVCILCVCVLYARCVLSCHFTVTKVNLPIGETKSRVPYVKVRGYCHALMYLDLCSLSPPLLHYRA